MKNTLDNYKDKNDNGKYVSGPSLFLVGSDGVFGNYGNSKKKTAASDRIMYEVFMYSFIVSAQKPISPNLNVE